MSNDMMMMMMVVVVVLGKVLNITLNVLKLYI